MSQLKVRWARYSTYFDIVELLLEEFCAVLYIVFSPSQHLVKLIFGQRRDFDIHKFVQRQ